MDDCGSSITSEQERSQTILDAGVEDVACMTTCSSSDEVKPAERNANSMASTGSPSPPLVAVPAVDNSMLPTTGNDETGSFDLQQEANTSTTTTSTRLCRRRCRRYQENTTEIDGDEEDDTDTADEYVQLMSRQEQVVAEHMDQVMTHFQHEQILSLQLEEQQGQQDAQSADQHQEEELDDEAQQDHQEGWCDGRCQNLWETIHAVEKILDDDWNGSTRMLDFETAFGIEPSSPFTDTSALQQEENGENARRRRGGVHGSSSRTGSRSSSRSSRSSSAGAEGGDAGRNVSSGVDGED